MIPKVHLDVRLRNALRVHVRALKDLKGRALEEPVLKHLIEVVPGVLVLVDLIGVLQ